ncbi:MAG: hypothetical protein VB036_00810 [Propionicimonas sp.]|nr:hypothetical protein [Propionicimonas sp.]
MKQPTARPHRLSHRTLAAALATALLWAAGSVPAQAQGDPSGPPDEVTAAGAPVGVQQTTPVATSTAAAPADQAKTGPAGPPPLTGPRHHQRAAARTTEVARTQVQTAQKAVAPQLVDTGGTVYGWTWDDYSPPPLGGITVELWRQDSASGSPVASAVTDGYGYYDFEHLAPGQYLLKFSGRGLVTEWWNDASSRQSATIITIGAGDAPVRADAELARVGSVTATVTSSAKKPISGQGLALQVWDKDQSEWVQVDYLFTDSKGKVTFANLPFNVYLVADWELPKGARLAVEGNYVMLHSYSGAMIPDVLWPLPTGEPGTGIPQKVDRGVGTWKKTTFGYQWLRDGASISKATAATYTPGTADRDHQLQVKVTSKVGNNSFTAISPVTWPIMQTKVPIITGPVAAGSTVTAVPGTWEEDMTFSYQWYANGKAISGATKPALTLTSSQKGKKLTVKVSGSFPGYPAKASRISAATGKVATAGTPTVSGSYVVGSTVKAKPGSWTKKTKFSYQWLRDGVAIRKATKASYKLTKADAGRLITVRVTGKLSGYATVARESKPAAKVLLAGTPSISGTAGTGLTLTARPGTWSPGASFTYRWYANNKAISGQTRQTLLLGSGQAGKKITVKVTGTLTGHATATTTSKATAKVLAVGTVTTTGTMAIGSTLKARPGSWTKKTKFSYQWLRDGVAIRKATKASYQLATADLGALVTVRVTGKLSGYATVASTSSSSIPVVTTAP